MLFEEIGRRLPELPESHRKVAGFILAHYQEAAFLTSTKLAARCGVSESTVIRFVNGLGLSRYADLQREMRELLQNRLSQAERFEESAGANASPMGTLSDMMRADSQSILKTIAELREEELAGSVDLLVGARRVFVIGTRSAFGLAHYFGSSLAWIREGVSVVDGSPGTSFDCLAAAGEGDAALAISLPPYPVNTIRLFRLAREGGAATIAVTDSLASPLAAGASRCLPVHNELMTFADSAAPVLSLLTALLALAGNGAPQRTARSLERLGGLWRRCGVYQETAGRGKAPAARKHTAVHKEEPQC